MYLRTETAFLFLAAIIAANVFTIIYFVQPQTVVQNQTAISAVQDLSNNFDVCIESLDKCAKDGNYEKVLKLENKLDTYQSGLFYSILISAMIIFCLLMFYFFNIRDQLKDKKELEIKYNELKQNLEAVQGKKK